MLNSLVYVALWSLDLKVVKSSKIVFFFYSKTLFYGFGFIFCYVSEFPVYFVVAAISVFVDKTMFFISSIVLRSWTSCNEGCGSWTAHRDFVRMHHNCLDVDFCSFSSDALAHKTSMDICIYNRCTRMFDVIYATILVIRSLNCNILEISVSSRIQSELNRN